jgi:3-hydroxyacyl-[acyl-carrier-protein] dehydratase
MLKNKLFYIDSFEQSDDLIRCAIHIDETHPIFKGHFPGQPVLPGVCMLEILKEVIEEAYASSFQLETASSVKFLTMFVPTQFTHAVFDIKPIVHTDNQLAVNASMKFEQHIFLKFNGTYKRINS